MEDLVNFLRTLGLWKGRFALLRGPHFFTRCHVDCVFPFRSPFLAVDFLLASSNVTPTFSHFPPELYLAAVLLLFFFLFFFSGLK